MAFQMNYTDQYGESYPQSYWRVEQWNFGKTSNGMVLLYGYSDAAHKGKRIIGQKTYIPTADEFIKYFSADAIDPLNNNPQSQAYEYALAKLDTDSGKVDQSGNPLMVSFFANAVSM